ncbi:MAG: hypothetical protein QOH89_1615 [Pseudonocardiales bacterium]|nr:hypothetical protein [Pseudonocardiales bacterium]
MRRSVFALTAASVLTIALAQPAWAVGPGGWSHVGNGGTPATSSLNSVVTALNSDNPGVLYVGGGFTDAGGHPNADRIAKWDGSAWSAIGGTPLSNGQVFAIAYHAGIVYIGGTFINAGGNPHADFLAAWNGTSWVSPCISTGPHSSVTGNVNALQIIGNTLYIGGSFANGADIEAADYLFGCDLTSRVASPVVDSTVHAFAGAVYALTADSNGTLYAGGGFTNLEGILQADHVAEFLGGGIWQAMGTGPGQDGSSVSTFVRSLTAHGTDVYVGTDALNVGGLANADHVAKWDGSAWSALGSNTAGTNGWFSNATSYTIDALDTYNSIVVAAGSFQDANGIATADDLAYFDGTQWRPIGSNGAGNGPLSQNPTALAVTGGMLYVGGNFTSAGGDTLARDLAAHALRLPDAAIGATSAGHFAGDGVYSSTGAGEVRDVTINRGTSKDVFIKVQNDGLAAATFTIKGTGGATGISDHYFLGGSNITAAVNAGTFSTSSIDPRGSVVLRLHIVVTNSSASHATFVTTARAQGGTPPDAVRASVTAN